MGSCFSHTAGGKNAVGGTSQKKFDGGLDALEAVRAVTGTRGLSSQIELSISASSLRNRDLMSKSDPMAVLYLKKIDGGLEELGRTEVILNSLSPSWITKLYVLYKFEEVQVVLIRVYDVDIAFSNVPPKTIPLQQQQFLGEMECILSEIVTAPNQNLTRALQQSKEQTKDLSGMPELGILSVRAEEMANSKFVVEMRIHCSDLDNKDIFTKSDPFLCISKKTEDGSFIPVYKTEVKKNSLNPTWKPVKVTLQQLCNGDVYCPLKIECFNFNGSGRHDFIGAVQTSLSELQNIVKHEQNEMTLERQSSGHTPSKVGGKIHFQECSLSHQHSFLDYIMEGFELSFLVAIDFTASNGNPYQRDSLHYIDPSGRQNAYQAAISAVGKVLEYYDSDKCFTVWGFGGKPSPEEPVSHCFNLNRSSEEVVGIVGIMEAYSQAVRQIHLAGPTLFGPVINKAALVASQAANEHRRKYFVLLIITDGVITDLQESINSLVKASGFPLSVLIVGVGGADFTEMEYLDADRGRLKSTDKNKLASRDIVQFVPMREVTGAISLAQMLLAELPTQFLEYMDYLKIFPDAVQEAMMVVQ